MNKVLSLTLVAAVCCFARPAWAASDTQDANPATTSNDKNGNQNSTYGSAGTPASENTSGEPTTMPSGKRHRTHRKHGNKAQSADANKTINSSDVTPSK